jgi:cytochrome c oxidase cbb3-type subunit 2
MKGLAPLILGIFGTFSFSWVGLTVIPNLQIGHLNPQMDEEGADAYPTPKSGMAERGRRVYVANGCSYCHTEQVRPYYAANDIDRKWGERRSAPRDYIFDRPVLLGKERMGPDLSNVGKRAPVEGEQTNAANAPITAPSGAASPAQPAAPTARAPAGSAAPPAPSPAESKNAANAPPPPAASPNPVTGDLPPYSAAWHHRHLYSPRSITLDSNMPAFRFLYEKHPIGSEPAANAVQLTERDAPPNGWEVIPTYEAECLVAYLMSLDQSHPLKEVKSAAPVAAPSASPAAPPPAAPPAASPPPPAQPPK